MPNESQDLIFNLKANTQNAEQGMVKIGRLTDDLKITTEKTSGALREFGGQLKQARDLSDVAGMATKALGQVLGASLGGTAVLVAGKALIDAFNVVQTAVKETEGKVKDAFKEIDKAGLPKTFEESATQADKLSNSADAVSKKIKEIESNPLQKFIAGITGARDKMDELVVSTQRAAQERIKLGVRTAIADEEFQRGLSEKEKALNALGKSYQDKIDQIKASMIAAGTDPQEIKKTVDDLYGAHTAARDKMLADYAIKEYAVEEENARKATDLRLSNSMAEFDLEQKSQNTAFEIERARLNEQIQTRLKAAEDEAKKREESAKKIEEYQNKLLALTEKRVALEEQLQTAKQSETIRQGELATMSAGVGGTARGAGQRPTSFEIGLQRAADRAYEAQRREEQRKQDEEIATDLYLQGGPGTHVTAQDVQREKVRRAEQAAREKAKKEFEDPYQKQIEKTTQALKNNEQEINNQKKAMQDLGVSALSAQAQIASMGSSADAAATNLNSLASAGGGTSPSPFADIGEYGGGGKTLSDVYELLDDTLNELMSYAHAG